MKRFNRNSLVSRIENIPEEEREWYGACGYEVRQAGVDYVCRRSDIAQLKGKAYKKKRASADFFHRHYDFEFRPYCSGDKEECCLLFESWIKGRKEKYGDRVYRQLLEDNFAAFKTVAEHYESLRFCGYVIRVKNELKAFTMGYPLGAQYFVVAFEICDLSVRGIAPFIFREFCSRLDCNNINIMDDCGLENLRCVKDSYRPYRKERIYIARCHE